MTIQELITELEEAAETLGDDAEVRLAYQPNWPMQVEIKAVVNGHDKLDPMEVNADQMAEALTLYIAGVESNDYAPGWVYGDAGEE